MKKFDRDTENFQAHGGSLPPFVDRLVSGNHCLRDLVCQAMVYVSRVLSGVGCEPGYAPPAPPSGRRRRRRWTGTTWTVVSRDKKRRASRAQTRVTPSEGEEDLKAPNGDNLCGWNAASTAAADATYDQYSAWRRSTAHDGDSANCSWDAAAAAAETETPCSVSKNAAVYLGRRRSSHRTATFTFRDLSFDLFIRGAEEDDDGDGEEFDLVDIEEAFPCWEAFNGKAAATAQGRFERYVCAMYVEFLQRKEKGRGGSGGKFCPEDGMVEMDF